MTADYDGQGQKKKVKTEYKTEIDELGGYGYGDSIEILGGGNNGTAADENDEKDMV
jgi:hypothetical protein